MAYTCFTDDGNQAAILATNLETGDVIGVCGDHITDYALGLLQSVTDTEWAPVGGFPTDPGSGDVSDGDEATDGPTVDAPPDSGLSAPPTVGGPGQADEPADDPADVPNPEWDVTPAGAELTAQASAP